MKEELTGRKLNSGFATLEILIAFTVIILCISAVAMVSFGNQTVALDLQTNNEAISKAQALLEKAWADSRFDFNLVNPFTTTEASGPLTFTKKLDVTQTDLFTKKVTSTVSWQTGVRNLSIIFTTLLTNPDAVDGGDTCSSVLEGDWTHPKKTEYEFGADILGDMSSGFPITSIQSFNKKMYVTVNNDNGNNDETFFVLDISDPAVKPIFLGKLDNSPIPNSISEGLNAVAVDDGNYAYVTNAYDSSPQNCIEDDNCAQLQVIDISNPSSPSVVKNFKIQSLKTGNKLSPGTSIFYKDGIVYLGLAKAIAGNDEFFVIDVGGGPSGGSPTNPVISDSAKIDNGINSIFVKNNYAYVASPDNSRELKIFDISTPDSISEVGDFNAPGGGGNNGNGKSLNLVGNTLYLGRTLLNGDEFYILNNINPETTLPLLGSRNILNGGSNSSVNGIIIRGNLGFLITNSEFQTLRIDNPSSITQYANPLLLPPGTGGGLQGTASDCEGNYIFVGSQSSNDKGYISIITGGP